MAEKHLDSPSIETTRQADRPRLSVRILGLVTLFYSSCLAIATYPAVWSLRTNLPSVIDPLVHIWTMRWYRSCLIEWKLPFFCPELQYPVGAPLGYLPPMHIQSIIYLFFCQFTNNDILIYNMIWVMGFLLTGVGTFCLALHVVRDRWCACMAGLLAMLSGPMMFWSHSQLEQITFGWFPLFLLAWLRWLERPTIGRVVWAAITYLLLSMSAPYHAVFGVIPALASMVWIASSSGGREVGNWARSRALGLALFIAITAPIMIILFSSQIWAMGNGFPMGRTTTEFNTFNASFWSFFVPLAPQLLTKILPDFYPAASGVSSVSTASAHSCAAWVVWRDGCRLDILDSVATIS